MVDSTALRHWIDVIFIGMQSAIHCRQDQPQFVWQVTEECMRYIGDWYGKTVEVEDSEYIELRDHFPEYLEGYGFSTVATQ